jgi:hypothetical protein
MTAALEGCEWSAARPGRTLLPGKTRYPFYRRLDGPQGRSGRAENLVPTGIRSRTVQPVVSRYIDWATRTTTYIILYHIIVWRWCNKRNTSDMILNYFKCHFVAINLLIVWQLSIWNCRKPFFPLLYNSQLLCFRRLALSIAVEVFPRPFPQILLLQGCLLQTRYA